ncbi:MAG: fimbria/pilus outer membrane usher protein, partial [Rectinema sp.]|nr:fimbria/pilus outer membrane usher protein [Rectinema sp.]
MKRSRSIRVFAAWMFFFAASFYAFSQPLKTPGSQSLITHDAVRPSMEIPFMLSINGKPYGEVDTGIWKDQAILEKQRIASILLNYLRPDVYSVIFDSVFSSIAWITADDFAVVGIRFSFNQSELTLSLDIPPEYSPVLDIDFVPEQVYNYKPILRPAPFSGWIHADSSLRIDAVSWSGLYFSSRLASTIDLHGTHMFANADLSSSASSTVFRLGDIYALWDSRAAQTQVWLGRFLTPGIGHQTRTTIWGISASSSESQPYVIKQGLIDDLTEFTLKKPAKVTIDVNRKTIRTAVLQPGNYRLLDLPFTTGLNEFVLKIEETDGTIQVFKRVIPRESNVIPQGTSRYALAAGVSPSDWTEFLATGYLLFGISPVVSAGIGLQADKRSAMGGLTWAVALPLGTLNGYASISGRWDGFGSNVASLAAQANYVFNFPTLEYTPSFGLSASYQGQGFVAPSLSPPSGAVPPRSISLTSSLYSRLAARTGISFGLGWSRTESTPVVASTDISGSLSQGFAKGGSLNLSVRYRIPSSGSPDLSAMLMFSIIPKGEVPRSLTFIQPLDDTGSLSLNDRLYLLGRIFNIGLNATNPVPGSGKDAA